MEIYSFLRDALAWTATVACLWPINGFLLALAFKIQQGPKPIDMENDEFWTRSFVTALVLGLLTAGFIFIDYMVSDSLPTGPTHLIVFVAYIPAAVWLLTEFFAQDDLLAGLGILVVYLALPIIVLFALNWATGLWNPVLDYVLEWLPPVT